MNAPGADETRASRWQTPLRWAAALWFVGFTVYFFTQGLPNAGTTRPYFWSVAQWQLLDCVLPPLPEPGVPSAVANSGWRFLPQRFGMIWWASLVLVGSWHLGSLIWRAGGVSPLMGRHVGTPQSDASGSKTAGLHFALAGLLGLSAWSLVVLALGLAGVFSKWVFGGVLAAFVAARWAQGRRHADSGPRAASLANSLRETIAESPRLAAMVLIIVTPFVLAMALGSLLPPVDFDVKAYHHIGPKEWFQAGRIEFLPHNVYTSFPFLTEMLTLSTMVLSGDWFAGAISGQLVLAAFGLYAAIVVFHLASAWGPRAAWLAALAFLTTPWVYRISIIAYVEGALAAYLAAALACFLQSRRDAQTSARWTVLCGLFAGSAAACKYPGVISALIPFGLLVLWEGWRSAEGSRLMTAIRRAVLFSAAGLAAVGPWLLKNLVQTGNPVYPLLWGLFGGRGFDADLNAKFKAGHPLPVDVLSDPGKWIPDLWQHLWDVAVGSDWQTPLMFGLAPVAGLVWMSSRRSRVDRAGHFQRGDLAITMGYALWLFLTWWSLTHRIDRFWVPMLPVLAVLAGVGLDWILGGVRRAGGVSPLMVGHATETSFMRSTAIYASLAATLYYNLAFIVSPLAGFNRYLMDHRVARRIAQTPAMTIINALPENSLTLLVGEAAVFDARRPVVYSTVFNANVFEELCAAPSSPDEPKAMKNAADLKAALQSHGITHVLVNWNEVLRYRTTYGYTDFVTPENVHALAELGVAVPEALPGEGPRPRVETQSDSRKFQLSKWGRSLVQRDAEGEWFPAYELWRVVE